MADQLPHRFEGIRGRGGSVGANRRRRAPVLEYRIQKPLDATHLLGRHLEKAPAKLRILFPFR